MIKNLIVFELQDLYERMLSAQANDDLDDWWVYDSEIIALKAAMKIVEEVIVNGYEINLEDEE